MATDDFWRFTPVRKEEECYVYERQPCWYLGKGCQARLHINADGTQATFIDDAGEQKWAVDSIADCASFYGASSGERTSGIWTGWVQLCGACAGDCL